jgi:hypothetical protein
VVFVETTFAKNSATADGGAVYADPGPVIFRRSTLSGNRAGTSTSAGRGGAVFGAGELRLVNSTLSENAARSVGGVDGDGGAIWHGLGPLSMAYTTVSRNTAAQGAGLHEEGKAGTLLGSILSRNRTGQGAESDCSFAIAASAPSTAHGNVVGQATCLGSLAPSDRVTTKIRVRPLADNGGPTRTMALRAGSPAIALSTRDSRRPTNAATGVQPGTATPVPRNAPSRDVTTRRCTSSQGRPLLDLDDTGTLSGNEGPPCCHRTSPSSATSDAERVRDPKEQQCPSSTQPTYPRLPASGARAGSRWRSRSPPRSQRSRRSDRRTPPR